MPGVADEFAQFRSPVKDEFAQFSRPAAPNAEETEIDAVAGRSTPLSPEVDDSGRNMGTRTPVQPGARGGVIELDPMTIEGDPDAGRGLPETIVRRGLSAIGVENAGPAVDRVASAGYRAVGLGSESVGRTMLAQQGARRDWRSTMLPVWNEMAFGIPAKVSETVSDDLERGEEDHPYISRAHQAAGALIGAAATAGVGPSLEGGSALGRMGRAAVAPAVSGGLSAYGHSDAEGSELAGQVAAGAAAGGLTGGLLQGATEGAAALGRAIPNMGLTSSGGLIRDVLTGNTPVAAADAVAFGTGTALNGGDWKKGLEYAALRRGGLSVAGAVGRAVQANPAAWGTYARVLSDAMARGEGAFMATFHVLQQRDPKFRKLTSDQGVDGAQSGQ